MEIELSKFSESLSVALDFAEKELLGVAPNHGMRIAVLASKMADFLGLDTKTNLALTQAAMFHDCALSEYLRDELSSDGRAPSEMDMSAHCKKGEEILGRLPFYDAVKGAVLFHHERADGLGAFGLTADKTPLCAQLIHMADVVDVTFGLYFCDEGKYQAIRSWIRENAGTTFSTECAEAFLGSIDYDTLTSIAGEGSKAALKEIMPSQRVDVSLQTLREMASVFAVITDYKSHFTWRHSMGIAEKAEEMGRFYGLTDEECDKLFVAGALHDVGKLMISNEILEKPGKLDADEYREIQNHAMGTWRLLSSIGGLEEICSWAALHHEKLDGSGYPFGKTADELGRFERLLACLDIYQALVEERPYKSGLPHDAAMDILRKMAAEGQLDTGILDDIDRCFANATEKAAEAGAPAAGVAPEAGAAPAADAAPQPTTTPTTEPSPPYWRCPVCGYIYEGDELPEHFICPRCEQPGTIFERVSSQ